MSIQIDMFQEYTNMLQDEVSYEIGELYFARSMDYEQCECGKQIKNCPDAYEHMSRGC